MIFKQFKDGSCDIEFSLKERFILFTKGKLHLSPEGLRHFGNHLVKMVSDWNANFYVCHFISVFSNVVLFLISSLKFSFQLETIFTK